MNGGLAEVLAQRRAHCRGWIWLSLIRPAFDVDGFLQRVINGGGRIDREYGLGRGALDLLITWPNERHAIEVKLRRDTYTEEDALEQLAGYLDRLGLDSGWLVLFDLRQGPTWNERLYQRDVEHAGKKIRIVGS